MRVDRYGIAVAIVMTLALLIGAAGFGCAAPAQSGVFKMEIAHRGKPVCAFYLPSDQDADDSIQMRFSPGPCPDQVIDQPISAEPRQ